MLLVHFLDFKLFFQLGSTQMEITKNKIQNGSYQMVHKCCCIMESPGDP